MEANQWLARLLASLQSDQDLVINRSRGHPLGRLVAGADLPFIADPLLRHDKGHVESLPGQPDTRRGQIQGSRALHHRH